MAAAKEARTPQLESENGGYVYRFGPFELDSRKRVLTRSGRSMVLPPKVFDTLVALVESSGHPVDNQTLIAKIWPAAAVDEAVLRFHVQQAQVALGEQKYIEALPPLGYRFIADLHRELIEAPSAPPPPSVAAAAPEAQPPVLSSFDVPADLPEGRSAGARLLLPAAAVAAISIGFVALRAIPWSAAPPEADKAPHRIGVTPFRVGSGGDATIAAAISGGLVPRLQSIPGLTVRGVEPGANSNGTLDAVLEGMLEKSGSTVKANVEFRSVTPGAAPFFTETFDIPASQVFSLEPIVAKRVAIALKSKLTPAQEASLLRMPTQNADAYRLYSSLSSGAVRDGRQRISILEKVVALDPEFAPAHAALADCYRQQAFAQSQPSRDQVAKSKASAARALELDERLAEAHVAAGYASLYGDWNVEAAQKSAKRALELTPNSAPVRNLSALLLTIQGKFDAAIAERRRALELDPQSEEARGGIAAADYFARRYERAAEDYRDLAGRNPSGPATLLLARSLRLKGANDEAFNQYLKADAQAGIPPAVRVTLKKAFEKGGFDGYWRKRLGQRGRANFYELAVQQLEAGRGWRSFKLLQRAYEARQPEMLFVHLDPVMEPIRTDERFSELVKRIGVAR